MSHLYRLSRHCVVAISAFASVTVSTASHGQDVRHPAYRSACIEHVGEEFKTQISGCSRQIDATKRELRQGGSLTVLERRQKTALLAALHNDRGLLSFKIGAFGAAERDFGEALSLAPNSVPALINTGIVQCRNGQKQAALTSFNKAQTLADRDDDIYFNRSICLKSTDGASAALADAQRAVAIEPDVLRNQLLLNSLARELGLAPLVVETEASIELIGKPARLAAPSFDLQSAYIERLQRFRPVNTTVIIGPDGRKTTVTPVKNEVRIQKRNADCPAEHTWNQAQARCIKVAASLGGEPNEVSIVRLFVATSRKPSTTPSTPAAALTAEAAPLSYGVVDIVLPKKAQDQALTTVGRTWWQTIVSWVPGAGPAPDTFKVQRYVPKSNDEFFREALEYLTEKQRGSEDRPEAYDGQGLVLVHGCCNTFNDSAFRLAQIVTDMRFNGAPFLFSWPTVGPPSSYLTDAASVEVASQRLQEFMKTLLAKQELKKVNFIAHSRGAHVLYTALRNYKASGAPGAERIGHIIFASPDLPLEIFREFSAEVAQIGASRTIYVNNTDSALMASRWHWGERHTPVGIRIGNHPVVAANIFTIDATGISADVFWSTQHSEYAEKTQLLNDIAMILLSGTQPPDKRQPVGMRRQQIDGGHYYKFLK